ncbi:MAG: cytochrome c-type biogenesis protein [Ardenticatenales bacterium]
MRHFGARAAGALGVAVIAMALAAFAPASAFAQADDGGATTAAVPAQTGATYDAAEADAIARSLNCPICEGRNLIDCPLPVCAEMRGEIRTRLAAGEHRSAIIQYFVDYYGERVRNTPPLSGLSGLAWWVPLAALIGGAAVVVRLVNGRTANPTTTPRPADADMTPGAPLSSTAAVAGSPGGAVDYAAAIERLAAARASGDDE